MGKSWKALEREVAKALGGIRRVRVGYGESVEDVIHGKFAIEAKYGRQVPKYCHVKVPTVLNEAYVLVPDKLWNGVYGRCRVERSVGYDLEFLQKGLAQAQQYNLDKIPLLCLKPVRRRGFVMVLRMSDYLTLAQEGYSFLKSYM